MTCREIQDRLPAFSAEALSRQQMRRTREHLDGCAACAGELVKLDGAMRLVERWGGVEPPPGLWEAVSREIEVETRDRRRGVSLSSWWAGLFTTPALSRLAPAALAGAALFAVFWSTRPETPSEQPPPGHGITIPQLQKEPEMVAAVQQHSLASAGLFLADRAGLESVVQIVRRQGEVP